VAIQWTRLFSNTGYSSANNKTQDDAVTGHQDTLYVTGPGYGAYEVIVRLHNSTGAVVATVNVSGGGGAVSAPPPVRFVDNGTVYSYSLEVVRGYIPTEDSDGIVIRLIGGASKRLPSPMSVTPSGDTQFAGAVITQAGKKGDLIQMLGEDFTADPPTITVAVDGSAWPNSTTSVAPYMTMMDKTPAWSANQNKVPSSLELTPQRYVFSTENDFQAVFFGDGDVLRMWVDGKRVQTSQVITASQTVRLNMAWSTLRRRTITIQAQQFLGARTVTRDTVGPGENGCHGSLVVIGDSWTVGGINYSKMSQLWPHLVARKIGVANYYAAGDSGTGYANDQNGPVFGDQTRWDASVAYTPDDSWVIVFGSINDAGYSANAMTAGANSLMTKIAAKFQKRKVIVVGPQWISSQNAGLTAANEAIIFAEAAKYGFTTLSTNGWFTGTGNVTTPAGDGNQDYYIGADTFHMYPRGHEYVADKIHRAMQAMCV